METRRAKFTAAAVSVQNHFGARVKQRTAVSGLSKQSHNVGSNKLGNSAF